MLSDVENVLGDSSNIHGEVICADNEAHVCPAECDVMISEDIHNDVERCSTDEHVDTSLSTHTDGVDVDDPNQLVNHAIKTTLQLEHEKRLCKSCMWLAADLADVSHALHNGEVVTDAVMVCGVVRNDIEILRELLCHGGNPNAEVDTDDVVFDGGTLLGYAVEHCHVDIVNVLLDSGADVDGCQKHTMTPLMCASACRRSDCVEALLRAGAYVNAVDHLERSALLLGASSRCGAIVKLLVDAGANVNVQDREYTTPLMVTCGYGIRSWRGCTSRREIAEILLGAGADVNMVNHTRDTALLMATKYDMAEVHDDVDMKDLNGYISLLLKAGASVHIAGFGGETPLMNVCRSNTVGGEHIIAMLLDAGADVHGANDCGFTTLMLAVQHGSQSIVRTVLASGARVDDMNSYGKSALALAALLNKSQIVAMLLQAGANVDQQDKSGATALMATFNCQIDEWYDMDSSWDVARQLIGAGADVNLLDKNGDTAMLWLARYYVSGCEGEVHVKEWKHCLTSLISGGASVNVVGSCGRTPLIDVCMRQHVHGEELVNALLDSGADVNAVDYGGNTALMCAAYFNNHRVVGALVSRGADVNMVNYDGFTVVQLHRAHRHVNISIVLLRAGADISHVETQENDILDVAKDIWRNQKLCLQHLCRETIRSCVLMNHPGRHVEELVVKLGLPESVRAYVADVYRYVLPSDH